jgi:hypothetical protein
MNGYHPYHWVQNSPYRLNKGLNLWWKSKILYSNKNSYNQKKFTLPAKLQVLENEVADLAVFNFHLFKSKLEKTILSQTHLKNNRFLLS